MPPFAQVVNPPVALQRTTASCIQKGLQSVCVVDPLCLLHAQGCEVQVQVVTVMLCDGLSNALKAVSKQVSKLRSC